MNFPECFMSIVQPRWNTHSTQSDSPEIITSLVAPSLPIKAATLQQEMTTLDRVRVFLLVVCLGVKCVPPHAELSHPQMPGKLLVQPGGKGDPRCKNDESRLRTHRVFLCRELFDSCFMCYAA